MRATLGPDGLGAAVCGLSAGVSATVGLDELGEAGASAGVRATLGRDEVAAVSAGVRATLGEDGVGGALGASPEGLRAIR